MEYKIRRIAPSDINNLIKLFKNSFRWNPSIAEIEKKYNTAILGPVNTGFIAFSDDETPAAYYGVFAVKLCIEGEIVQAAQSGDTATHSNHRGKGLFIELAKKTYSLCNELGIEIVFGFPNKNSYPGFVKKLNWVHMHDIDVFSIPVRTVPIIKLVRKFPILKETYLSVVRMFIKNKVYKPDSFSSVISKGLTGIYRDGAYLSYKESRDKFFLNNHSISWVKFDGSLIIGDVIAKDSIALKKHLKWLKRIAFFTGCNKITFCSSPDTVLHQQFSEIATVVDTMPVGIMAVSERMLPVKIFFTGADFDNF